MKEYSSLPGSSNANAVLGVLAGMALMVTYVETMVLPAFEQFYTFFDGPPLTTIAWILSAYLLVGVVVTPIFGKLGDRYGKKRMLLLVMSIYAVAVSLAGFSPNIGAAFGIDRMDQIYVFIGTRAVQGIGMAMFPLAFAMIPEVFPPQKVGQAQGLVSAMFAVGAALGLVGGGYIAQTYGWQLTYHTVIPVAVILVALTYVLMNESTRRWERSIDVPGILGMGFSLAMLMFAITEGSSWGWTNFAGATWGKLSWGVPEFFLLSVVGLVLFLFWEPRSPSPVVNFHALKERNIWISNVNGVIAGMAMFLTFVSMTVLAELPYPPGFSQDGFQFGLIALPSALTMLATGPFIGRAVSRWGPKPVMEIGFAAMALGALALVFQHGSLWELVVYPIPILAGNVACLISMSNIIILSVDPRELGIQTGMNQTFRNLGSAIGPVLSTSLLAAFTTTVLLPFGIRIQLYTSRGFEVVFGVTVLAAIAGGILSLFVRNFRFLSDGTRHGHPGLEGIPEENPVAEVETVAP